MQFPTDTQALAVTLRNRRQKLAQLIDGPVVLWAGTSPSRNFPANIYPFRASSHFLYFAGLPLDNAVIRIEKGKLELFLDNPSPGSALWHGEVPTRDQIATVIGADNAFPKSYLPERVEDAATILVQDAATQAEQHQILNRLVYFPTQAKGMDLELIQAIIQLRLTHDGFALNQLREAVKVTVAAHKAGMAATAKSTHEANIRGAMEGVIIGQNMATSYNSIVTVNGEVLHNQEYHHSLQQGDLLLADVGAETPLGWAADVTRTWPVSGEFSGTQRDIYEVVEAAHHACIEQVKPDIEYEDIHLLAARVMAQGLVDLGILKGDPDTLVEQDAHALFFPHGVGHVLGLDVHDMEDLGDLAGYASGRSRSQRFGLGFLRLNRSLQTGMVVTIEPGFYQVPGILNHPEYREKYHDMVNWERLEQFADVRGIRIEDDVLVTDEAAEVLTKQLPTDATAIEELVNR
ncbi:MAG: aminopeptidase P family protein [Microcoleaceae cyanobacterium]